MTASPDTAARFQPVVPQPAYADVRLDESTPEPARSAIYEARAQALAELGNAHAETRLLLFPSSGMVVDASSFIAEHAGETPTSLGVPAIRLRKVEACVEDLLDRLWLALEATGSAVVDAGVRAAYVRRDGLLCLIALHDLSFVEAAAILAGVRP